MVLENENFSNKRPEPLGKVLYIVGTPIGNLGDLSPRAKKILREVSVIACEDTRYSGQLIRSLESHASLISFHSHNRKKMIPKLISFLKEGKSLALISDAGLPGISDPGEDLVSSARKSGFEVICIPGACAATTALISSGLPSGRFCFEGFIPTKTKERKKRLQTISKEQRTSIIFEAPHRLIKLLKELAELCGEDREIHISRELTKIHEEHIGPTIEAALTHFHANKPIGECTVILGGNPLLNTIYCTDNQLIERMQKIIRNGSNKSEAAKKVAEETGNTKRYLYQLLHSNINKGETISINNSERNSLS